MTDTAYRDVDAAHPMKASHERYAVLRAQGMTVGQSAREAGVKDETARRYWEPSFTKSDGTKSITQGACFKEDGVGGAIQRRIAFLREAMATESAYTPGMLLHMQMDLIRRAALKGDFGTALKFLDKIRVEVGDSSTGKLRDALPVPSEDVTHKLRGGEDE